MRKGLRILLVEDDKDDADFFAAALTSMCEGCVLHIADHIDDALGFLRGTKTLPDLIITDYILPRSNASQLLHSLKADARYACVPVIVFTSSDTDDVREECLEAGAALYLLKPKAEADLEQMVLQMLVLVKV